MILTKDNCDTAILGMIMRSGYGFYDPKTSKIFDASPCDSCGKMSAHGNEITIESISDALHRTLVKAFRLIDWNECIGYDDDGNEYCDSCG